MKLLTQIIILFLFLSCDKGVNKTEIEIAKEYFDSQQEFNKSNLNKVLSDNVKVFYGRERGTDSKNSLIKSAGFSYGLDSENELIKITQIDTNKVELIIKESDNLTKHLEIEWGYLQIHI